MDLRKYRELAEKGGEMGEAIEELLAEIEQLQKAKMPKLLNATETCDVLEISIKNLSHARKTKFFPEPFTQIGTRPFWLESEIYDYRAIKQGVKKEDRDG